MNKTISFKASPAQLEFLKYLNEESVSGAMEELFSLAGFEKFQSKEGVLRIYQDYNFDHSCFTFTNGLKQSPKINMQDSMFDQTKRYLGIEMLYISMVASHLYTPNQLENANGIEVVNLVSGEKQFFNQKEIEGVLGSKIKRSLGD